MRGMRPSGVEAVAEKCPWTEDREFRRLRDRTILKMSKEGVPSRQIAIVLNIHPASVRRIRARLSRRLRERAESAKAS